MKASHSKGKVPGAGGKKQTKFKGLVADARALGVTRVHLWRVLTGRCKDNKGLLKRYHAIKTHGTPYLNQPMRSPEFLAEFLRRLDEVTVSQKRLTKAQRNIEEAFQKLVVAANARLAALSEEERNALAPFLPFPEVMPVRKQISQEGAQEPEK